MKALLNLCLLIAIVGFATGCDSKKIDRPEESEGIVEVEVDSDGGSATSSDGKVQVSIPSDAIDSEGVLRIEKVSPPEASANAVSPPEASANARGPTVAFAGDPYDISLEGAKLTSAAEVRFESPDGDGDGIIDGTNVKARYGNVAFWSNELEEWIEPLQVYKDQAKVQVAKVLDFSARQVRYLVFQPWDAPRELRWKVTSLPTNGNNVDRADLENEIEFAFNTWEVETGRVGLTFTKVGPAENADIVIKFDELSQPRKTIDRIQKSDAFTSPYQDQIIFKDNNNRNWYLRESAAGSSSIVEVGIHEIGHAIGLVHPCWECTEPPIMAPQPDGQKSLYLSPGDIAQVRDRYDIPDPQSTGQIRGSVTDAASDQSLSDVSIEVRDANGDVAGVGSTDQNGSYQILAPEAEGYTVAFSKDGYLPVTYDNVSVTADQDTYLEPVLQVNEDDDGTGTVQGRVVNATTGDGVEGVELFVREGLNDTTSSVVATTTTDEQGQYQFPDLEAGNYTTETQKAGYSNALFTFVCLGNQTRTVSDAAINPETGTGTMRIVLSWGETPDDLDSHLTGPTGDGDRFHVFYANDVVEGANLDRDDITSFGPETITIESFDDGLYRYSVHDYTNRDASESSVLSASGAQVKVYRGDVLTKTFNVPTNEGGTLWTVFEMEGEEIIPVNSLSYESNPSAVNSVPAGQQPRTDAKLIDNLPSKK